MLYKLSYFRFEQLLNSFKFTDWKGRNLKISFVLELITRGQIPVLGRKRNRHLNVWMEPEKETATNEEYYFTHQNGAWN